MSRVDSLLQAGFVTFVLLLVQLLPSLASSEEEGSELDVVVELLAEVDDADLALELLEGLREGLKGRKKVAMPAAWPAAFAKLSGSDKSEVRETALALALVFDDPNALKSLHRTLLDMKAPEESRLRALRALTERRTPGLAPDLHELLRERPLRRPVLRALASYEDESTPRQILALYATFDAAEKQDAVSTLASRPSYALRLLAAVEKGTVSRRDVTAIHARQLQNLGDERVSQLLGKVWGDVRQSSEEKKKAISAHKKFLTPGYVAKADVSRGRLLFSRTCEKCHRLYDAGASIGPELTGSNRANLDYILENILDPSATIGKDYRLTTAVTRQGRIVAGILKERASRRVTIQTENELVTLAEEDLLSLKESATSMMPDGLLKDLSREEVRDLIGYLASSSQVALPVGEGGER